MYNSGTWQTVMNGDRKPINTHMDQRTGNLKYYGYNNNLRA